VAHVGNVITTERRKTLLLLITSLLWVLTSNYRASAESSRMKNQVYISASPMILNFLFLSDTSSNKQEAEKESLFCSHSE
jgi:hypothetical protein